MNVHAVALLAVFIDVTNTSADFVGADIPCNAEVNALLGVLPDIWKECYYERIGTEDVLLDCDTLDQKDFCGAAQECYDFQLRPEFDTQERAASMCIEKLPLLHVPHVFSSQTSSPSSTCK